MSFKELSGQGKYNVGKVGKLYSLCGWCGFDEAIGMRKTQVHKSAQILAVTSSRTAKDPLSFGSFTWCGLTPFSNVTLHISFSSLGKH